MKTKTFPLLLILILVFSINAIADEYIVDNDDGAPAYQQYGTWQMSSSSGYDGGTYLFTHYDDPPSSASWTPEILTPGRYEIYYMFRSGSNRSPSAPFTITHAQGIDIVRINMSGSGAITEEFLGEFLFDAGTSGSVQLSNDGPPIVFIADAVRFVTAVDDPPEITEITRSPGYPQETEPVIITANIKDDSSVTSAVLNYSTSPSGSSDSLIMHDDGLHSDGESNDDIYGATIPPFPDGEEVEYYIIATDDMDQVTESDPLSYIVGLKTPREYRSIWADSWNRSILDASQVEELVQTCRENNINTIMAEIRKIGDAYYNSNIEPRATNITGGPQFDPLDYLIQLAHDTSEGKKYIHVHGWFVMQRITKGETLNPNHILSTHPEYVMYNSGGSTGTTNKFLDPGHPGAVDHNVAVIMDCLKNYDIDGINLDYIRYPEESGEWGYNPTSVARFNAFYGKTGNPFASDPDWDDWRRECVTFEVKKIYVKAWMIKPHVVLTADTINWGYNYDNYTASSAYAGVFQDWVGWLQKGIMDYNALMNYSTSTSRYEGWTDLSLASDDKRGSIIGIGAYLQSSVQRSMDQLLYARAKGADGLNIYDWYSEASGTSESRSDFYSALKSQLYPDWADPPEPKWKTDPVYGIFEGNVSNYSSPVDHATVLIDGSPATATHTDGSGWYAILEVSPGSHMLRFSKPGLSDVVTSATIPKAGDIITVDIDFFRTPTAWVNY